MSLHRNAKLGLAGRRALVAAIAGGMSLKAAAACFSVSPATAHRWWHRWLDAGEEARATLSCLLDRSSRPRRSPAAARARARGARSARADAHGLGAAADRRRDRLRALDGLEGAPARRDLAAAAGRAGAGPPLRVALPRRPAAHGRQRVRALRAARPPRHRRPPSQDRRAPRTASTTSTRSSTTTPASPTPRSTPTQRAATVTGFLERALAFYAAHGSGRSG